MDNPHGKIFLTTIHHSDLTWQYSYERYNAIREEQLDIVMGFFEKYPGYGFILDQAYVLQNYLSRNPGRKEMIARLVDHGDGSLELAGGYSIPDLNLCGGESFIRNCLAGQAYYEREFGQTTKIASLMDAFGMPAQMPQLLAQLGYEYLIPGRMANAPQEVDTGKPFLWRGFAGTQVVVVPNGANVDKSSYRTNVPVVLNESERFHKTLTDLKYAKGDVLAYYMTEIQMLDEAFFSHLAKVNGREGGRPVTFGRLADYCKTVDATKLPGYMGEFNPVFTGCYTTRIGIKQKIRAAENALFAAELAMAWAKGGADFADAWAQLFLGQFHDAACGCHHDISNRDIHAKLDDVLSRASGACAMALGDGEGGAVLVLNPSAYTEERLIETTEERLPAGVPVQRDGAHHCFVAALPAHGVARFDAQSGMYADRVNHREPAGYRGQTDCFSFDFAQPAPRIKSKRFARSVFGQGGFGELLFRHENGTMWDEVLLESPLGAECQEEAVVAVEEGPVFVKVTTKGFVKPGRTPMSGNHGDYWPGFESLAFTKEYIFPNHLPYFKLRLTLHFFGCNTKVSLRIPTQLDGLEAVGLFDTPFAAVQRRPYYEVPYRFEAAMQPLSSSVAYAHARGDYPALHFVDFRDSAMGLAIANSGTPGHQQVGQDIHISLLRSGTRVADGTMYPQPGAYDNGTHVFEFAFADHAPDDPETAAWLGSILNRAPVVAKAADLAAGRMGESIVKFEERNILVSAVYPMDGKIIVRAYEAFGKETSATLCRAGSEPWQNGDIRGNALETQDCFFMPYEIKTFVLEGK